MSNSDLKNQVLEIVNSVFSSKSIEFTIDNYKSESDNEVLFLTDVISNKCKITISDDFALIVIEGEQYDFEEWRYRDKLTLLSEFRELLNSKI